MVRVTELVPPVSSVKSKSIVYSVEVAAGVMVDVIAVAVVPVTVVAEPTAKAVPFQILGFSTQRSVGALFIPTPKVAVAVAVDCDHPIEQRPWSVVLVGTASSTSPVLAVDPAVMEVAVIVVGVVRMA